MYKIKRLFSAIAMMGLMINSSHAAVINFEFTGIVDSSTDFKNGPSEVFLFELAPGDTVTAAGTFDDVALTGGSGAIDFTDSINNITLTIGNTVFIETATTQIAFNNYDLSAINFTSPDGDFVSIGLNFLSGSDLLGHWVSASIAPVPVPAAVWLFGSGLLGLVGLARRKAA